MAIGTAEILGGLVGLLILFYYYLTKNSNYWQKLGVKGRRPIPFYGNMKSKDSWRFRDNISLATELYNEFKDEPLVGAFFWDQPTLILRDPEVLKDVLIKNFNCFSERGIRVSEEVDPLNVHLLFMEPPRWRHLRTKLTPAFTSGKMKNMFYLMDECGDQWVKYVEDNLADSMDARKLSVKYTMDVVGTCVFGLNLGNTADEDSQFVRYGQSIIGSSMAFKVKRLMADFYPRLYRMLKPLLYDKEMTEFFTGLVSETMKLRKTTEQKRHDFIDILIELTNQAEEDGDEKYTDLFLAAQAFVFFMAGFETSSTTISHALLELALNPDIQDKLRNEIIEERAKNDGKITFEAIRNMKYLDKVFKETLRKYPSVKYFTRRSCGRWEIPGKDVHLPIGTRIIVPIWAIHRDSELWPDPGKFDPERFTPEMESARHPMTYIPFGDGPRVCIGARFAKQQSKLGIVKMLENFSFEVSEKMQFPYRIDPACITLSPIGGTHLKIKKLKKE